MNRREEIVYTYFRAWIEKDNTMLVKIFNTESIYSECYGPEYKGIHQIQSWFSDWNQQGSVLAWDVKQIVYQNDMVVVEWYFKCVYDGTESEFNGVSWIQFDENDFIINLKEFQSKIPHYFPYH